MPMTTTPDTAVQPLGLHIANNSDNVYGAVIMAHRHFKSSPVHLMNAHWAPSGCQPSDQAN